MTNQLPRVVAAVQAAGEDLAASFRRTHTLRTREDVVEAIAAGDRRSLRILRPALEAVRPGAGWVEDELADGALPPGEWWVTDPVEGAVNRVHGLTDWAVTATLVRDDDPVLTVVHLPLAGLTCTAVRGEGAFRNGERLTVSGKQELAGAVAATGQASPRESEDTWRRIGGSLTAMMAASLVTRSAVPPTLLLVDVAAGGIDVFWQHSAVRSGLLAGALLVAEAGGLVSDLEGRPWSLGSRDFLAAAPGVRAEALAVLKEVR